MEPIIYRKRIFDLRDGLLLVSLGFFLVSLGYLMLAVLKSLTLSSWEVQVGAELVWRGFVVWGNALAAAIWFYLALPRHNQLQFDKDGLTYRRARHRSAWPWRDISAFTLVRRWYGPRIEFTVNPRHDRGWGRHTNLRKTRAGLTGAIPNIWDAPLDDIAATLNEYRERALGGANGPASPEPA